MANNRNGKKQYFDQYGQPVDEFGYPVDQYGRRYADYDGDGNPPDVSKRENTDRAMNFGGVPRGSRSSSKKRSSSSSSGKKRVVHRSKPVTKNTRKDTGNPKQQQTRYDPQTGEPIGQRSSGSRAKRRRKSGIGCLPKLILVLLLILGLGFWFGNSLLNKYQYDDTNESKLSDNVEDGVMNIALFGVDTRADQEEIGTRSDAMMIMSVDTKRNKVKLISLMRDSLVEVPGHGKTKLCHAYSYGGAQLSMETMNQAFDMNITEYMTVDFAQMTAIIDSVGGIPITLTEEELIETNRVIAEYCLENNLENDPIEAVGEQKLNGLQAMNYGRIRKGNTGGDWSRTERQSVVLNAVFAKASSNPINMLRFLHGILPNITSSMSKGDFWYMGLTTIIHGVPSMEHIRLPLDGEWNYGTTSSGMSVITFDDAVLAKHLHEYFYNDIMPTAE